MKVSGVNRVKTNTTRFNKWLVSYWVSVWRLRAAGPLGLLCQWCSKPQGLIHRVHLIATGFTKELRHDKKNKPCGNLQCYIKPGRYSKSYKTHQVEQWFWKSGVERAIPHRTEIIMEIKAAHRSAWLLWCSHTVPGSVMESCSTAESLLAEERQREKREGGNRH